MATASQIKAGLNEIAVRISNQRAVIEKAKSNAALASASLSAILADYADVLATIDAIPGGTTNDLYKHMKAEKAALSAEFISLRADADAIAVINLTD